MVERLLQPSGIGERARAWKPGAALQEYEPRQVRRRLLLAPDGPRKDRELFTRRALVVERYLEFVIGQHHAVMGDGGERAQLRHGHSPWRIGAHWNRVQFSRKGKGPHRCRPLIVWLRGKDLNLRPSGYEPDELPDCSTPRLGDEL